MDDKKFREFNGAVVEISKQMAGDKVCSLGIDLKDRVLLYAVLRQNRSDDGIAEMMRKYKVLLSMTYMNYLGQDYCKNIRYKILETQEEYDAALAKGQEFVKSISSGLSQE